MGGVKVGSGKVGIEGCRVVVGSMPEAFCSARMSACAEESWEEVRGWLSIEGRATVEEVISGMFSFYELGFVFWG
jgi:hypothetical protein